MNLETLRMHRAPILRLAQAHKLENVRVFGSTVRGDADEDSDVDMLVHPAQGCSLFDLAGFEIEVSSLLGGVKVDVLDDEAIKDVLVPYIMAEAVPL